MSIAPLLSHFILKSSSSKSSSFKSSSSTKSYNKINDSGLKRKVSTLTNYTSLSYLDEMSYNLNDLRLSSFLSSCSDDSKSLVSTLVSKINDNNIVWLAFCRERVISELYKVIKFLELESLSQFDENYKRVFNFIKTRINAISNNDFSIKF